MLPQQATTSKSGPQRSSRHTRRSGRTPPALGHLTKKLGNTRSLITAGKWHNLPASGEYRASLSPAAAGAITKVPESAPEDIADGPPTAAGDAPGAQEGTGRAGAAQAAGSRALSMAARATSVRRRLWLRA